MSNVSDSALFEQTARSPEDMDALASTLAPHLRSGDVFLLNGDLGAGKTKFVQGVARALGVQEDVTSPTFTILISYHTGSLPINHFDLYRLEDSEELTDIGYWDVLEDEGIAFIEWGDKFPDDEPYDFVEMTITAAEDGMRSVRVVPRGQRAQELVHAWSSSA